ncbi:ComEA family DNA-binding protein [Terriglobus tenax]|uniref:ComEA family DNA-binding protein n=1 Tax=Terriglobus tenax TaxID=1111115 RepID=UPI0021E0A9D0|nr:helix-hairpin-helix domain-containing protein [Terriglobus tenax]
MISPRKLVPYLFAFLLAGLVSLTDAILPPVQAQQTIAEKIEADKTKLDLNTATVAELKSLGLGDNYIKRIIDGRPYTAKNQLVSRGVLPQAAYEPIKERVIAHRPKKQ